MLHFAQSNQRDTLRNGQKQHFRTKFSELYQSLIPLKKLEISTDLQQDPPLYDAGLVVSSHVQVVAEVVGFEPILMPFSGSNYLPEELEIP